MPRLPTFVIIGAPRSGTTSLAYSLSQHPEVFVTMQVKELHFFDTNFDRGLDWYREQFSGPDADAAKAAGEATPTYMYDEEAMSRMAETVPDAKLVAILRNPVDRAYSHYWMNRSLGREDLLFPVAIETEAERLAGGDPRMRRRYGYVERGRYVRYLKAVTARLPANQLHVMITEEFDHDPPGQWKALCSFLGADPSFTPPDLGRNVNAHADFRSLRLRLASKRWPGPLRNLVGKVNRREIQYPEMDSKIRAQLEGELADDNGRLAAWLGRSLPWDAPPRA
jgi:hypothetical protein